jgi:hypothetical protein
MQILSLTFCLAIAALLASVGGGLASSHLPKCPSENWSVLDKCLGGYQLSSGNVSIEWFFVLGHVLLLSICMVMGLIIISSFAHKNAKGYSLNGFILMTLLNFGFLEIVFWGIVWAMP